MRAVNYTEAGAIVRGSRWPPGNFGFTLELDAAEEWPDAAAEDWTWTLAFSPHRHGGEAELILTAETAAIEDISETVNGVEYVSRLKLGFYAMEESTEGLAAEGDAELYVDLWCDVGGSVVSCWDAAAGTAQVRDAAGEGTA